MHVTWQTRLQQQPHLKTIENWPTLDRETIQPEKRRQFVRNLSIVSQVLHGHSYRDVAQKNGVSISFVSKLLHRALAGDESKNPALSAALVPHTRLIKSRRRATLPSFTDKTGSRCAFQHLLLNVPNLRIALDKVIKAHIGDYRQGQNLKPKAFHEEFLRLLADAHWPRSAYPYTETLCGYESARQYLHRRTNELLIKQTARRQPKREIRARAMVKRVYQEIQLDEQRFDLYASVGFEVGGDLKAIPVSRVSLVLALDVATNCILSYSLALTAAPNQDDILECLGKLHKPWQPRDLVTPGLSYPPGAGFPVGIVHGAENLAPGEFRLDNAWAHSANTIRHYIAESLGATLNLGIPASPKQRNWVEYAFKLASDQAHRFVSTSGSHPNDPKKQSKKNSKKPPIINLLTVEEYLDVLFATHNATPKPFLEGASPLEIIQEQIQTKYLPVLSELAVKSLNVLTDTKTVTVRWDKSGFRLPHINFAGVRYRGDGLAQSDLVNQKIRIQIDRKDIRHVTAYTLLGEKLGTLDAPRSWQRFAHSLRTRKLIFDYTKSRRRKIQDQHADFFAYLLENKELPSTALEIVRVYREATQNQGVKLIPLAEETVHEGSTRSETSANNDQEFPDWTPDFSGIEDDDL
ncbi:hypothetical protein [Aurantivibrio infirmus]